MWKYLAILKDSLREAIDNKILYVMVGLSFLIIAVIASMSFRPLSADKAMKSIVQGEAAQFLNLLQPERIDGKHKRGNPFAVASTPLFAFKGVKLQKGEADSPDSEYLVTVVRSYDSEAEAADVRADARASLDELKKQFEVLEDLGHIHVASARLADTEKPLVRLSPKEVTFELVAQPARNTRRIWPHEPSLFFGALPLGEGDVPFPLGIQLFLIGNGVMNTGAWVALLVSVIISAFFIPNMLRKGTVDLLLVKPISRWSLLLNKYVGGLTFIFINTAIALSGMWLALGWRSGIWAHGLLLMILVITFFFAILYAVSTLLAVLWRSAIVCILLTCGAWFFFFLVGLGYQVFDAQQRKEELHQVPASERWSDNAFGSVVRAIHFVTPRTSDLNQLGQRLMYADFLTGSWSQAARLDRSSVSWGESLTVSLVFIVLMLTIACWRFSVKDY
jgi:ABC-type transport system involved in multi-copper enzyme maturation permease subunit